MNKVVVYTLAGILSIALGLGGAYLAKKYLSGKEAPIEGVGSVGGGESESPIVYVEPEPQVPPTEEEPVSPTPAPVVAEEVVSAPVLAKSGHSVTQTSETAFSVSLKIGKNAPKDAEYVLSDNERHRYTSATGKFSNVSSNASGKYTAVVRDKATGLSSEPVSISGFIPKEPVRKLSAAEVEANLNTGNRENFNEIKDHFVANPAVRCNVEGIKRMSEVYQCVNMDGKRATVSNIVYDFLGRIKSFSVTLN